MRDENELYKKYLKEGLNNFRPVQILELLLGYVLPETKAREMAEKLIGEFGNITALLSADSAFLEGNYGIHPDAVYLLKILAELPGYMGNEEKSEDRITGTYAAAKYAAKLLRGLETEKFYITLLDEDKNILSTELIASGGIHEVSFDIHTVLQFINSQKTAKWILLMHNHPGGLLNPSKDDIYITEQIKRILVAVGIKIFDHIIITDNHYVSMKERGFVY